MSLISAGSISLDSTFKDTDLLMATALHSHIKLGRDTEAGHYGTEVVLVREGPRGPRVPERGNEEGHQEGQRD